MTTSPPSPPASESLILPPTAQGQIEIWKKIVDVQQHFNDLELRIRNFALVVTGAFLGLGGYAIKDGGIITLFGYEVTTAGLVVFSAILPLFAFYFMDRLWYHRLLDGSVKAGIDAEKALKSLGYEVDLGSQISAASPFMFLSTRWRIHSKTKMDIFYGMLLFALLLVAACLGFGVRPQSATPPNPGSFAVQSTPSGTSPAPRQEKPLPAGPIRAPVLTNPRSQTAPRGPEEHTPASSGEHS
jgi:hypothetical protein